MTEGGDEGNAVVGVWVGDAVGDNEENAVGEEVVGDEVGDDVPH